MLHFFVKIILSFTLFKITSSQTFCEPKHCNYGGVCSLVDGNYSCACVASMFYGSHCEFEVDHCQVVNSCAEDSTCIPFPGSYNCICQKPNQVQNCSKTPEEGTVPQNVYFYFNPVIPVNEPQNYILVIEKLGSNKVTVEVSTPNYAFASYPFSENDIGVLRKINKKDLLVIARKMKLRNVKFPHETVYYAVFSKVITVPGSQVLTVSLGSRNPDQRYYIAHVDLTVYIKPKHCFPIVQQNLCNQPRISQDILLYEFNTFAPKIERSCGVGSRLTYEWSFANLFDTKILKEFPDQKSNILMLPPFSLWIDFDDPLKGQSMIKLKVLEENLKTRESGFAISRCFIFLVTPPPQPNIIGGFSRKVSGNDNFYLNGSLSKDLAFESKDSLMFKWNCTSNVLNEFCANFIGKAAEIEIPKNTIKSNEILTFTMAVKSIKTKLSSYAVQEIIVVEDHPLFITIICVSNCEPHTNLHENFQIQAKCEECTNGNPIVFKWSFNSKDMSNTSRLILDKEFFQKNVNYKFKVNVEYSEMFGEAFFILKINLPPTDGNCSIQPESGIAFITNFQVICQGFKDVDIPIKYSVIQDELLVVQSQDKEFNLRLNKMEDEFIQIKVEDSYGAFSLEKLKVSVDSLKKDEIMKIFTKNLSDLVQMNDLPAAVTLINLAIPEINDDDVEKTGEIVDALLKLHYPTVPSIKLVLGSLKNLSAKFILAHDVRRKISEVFDKISSSLDLILKFPNKMQLEDVELIAQNALKITNKLVVPFEMMLPQNHLPESSEKLDDYPDYEEFDEEIEDKMYNLNQVAESTNSLLQKVSRLFLLAIKAEEPNINITLENSTFIFKTVDINNKISLEFDDKTKIEMNEEFMDDFKKNHGNVLSLSILSYEKNNPFWFNNLQDQQKSSVFTLEIFDEICQKTQYFGIPFEFSSEFNEIKTREIHFQIQPTNDMPVFEIVFPKNSKLLVNFTSSDFPIKVLEKFNRRPQFKEMLKDYKIFPTETGDTHFYLDKKNVNRSRDELIFLGILSVAAVPSNISMTISILSCNSWDAAIRDWSNKICMPLTLNGTSLKCSCSGPSTFQSTIFAAQHKLDPRRETLYAIEGNWIVLSTVIILVAIFVLSLLWAWKRDKEEKLCRKIVYLKSNRPDDQIVYLLTLETGAFKHSDTTSIILIRINGSNMQSKTILLEKEQKRFKRSSKWTFLIKSQHHLGAIESLNIWIIPSGSKSSWYCERIEIRDMLKLEQYNFIVCKWISLTREDGKIYCTVQLASKADLEQDQSKSKRNFLKTLHESFSTFSIFARHSRLTLNWRQRLTITFVWISISTFFSILLFGQTELENIEDEHEEFSKFSFNQKVFLVALQIQVIIWPLFRILEYFYNKRKKSFTNDFEVIHRE